MIRMFLARRKLQRIVDAKRNSVECVNYRRHREAGKKAWASRLRRRALALRATPPAGSVAVPASIADAV